MFKVEKRKWVFLLFPFVFFGCIQDVTIKDITIDSDVVLNCILNPGKDTVTVKLTYSRPIQSTTQFEAIKNANILLFEEGFNVGEFVWADSSAYVLPHSVKPGIKYRIEAKVENKTIWAETTIPKTVDATIERANPESYMNEYRIKLNDRKDEDNFYWVSATGYEGAKDNRKKNIACTIYSNFKNADDFNQFVYQNGNFKFEYDYYLRFADNALPNNVVGVLFSPQCIDYPEEVFLLSVDYQLDKYMKSSLALQSMDLYAEDSPIIYSPFPVYSNIHGGTGIFGSFSSISKVFTKE